MKKYFNLLVIIFILIVPLAFLHAAGTDKCGIGVDPAISGLFKTSFCKVSDLIGAVIQFLFAILGLISALFIIIGGFRYVFAQGDAEAAKKARQTITNAVIGLVIAALAYTIVGLVASTLDTSGSGTGTGTGGGGGGAGGGGGTGGCDPGTVTAKFGVGSANKPSSVNLGDVITITTFSSTLSSSCSDKPTYTVTYLGPQQVSDPIYCPAFTVNTPCSITVGSSNFAVNQSNLLQVSLNGSSGAQTSIDSYTFTVNSQ